MTMFLAWVGGIGVVVLAVGALFVAVVNKMGEDGDLP